jgi:HTH-type transcriptional regulator / antitoxin HigA
MRVFSTNTLSGFGRQHSDAANAARELSKTLRAAHWSKMQDVLDSYPSATVLNAERVVFKLKGNDYRAIVAFNFHRQGAFVKFVGTHSEYDRIDALTVGVNPGASMTEIFPIRDEVGHRAVLAEIERLWNAVPGSPEDDRLDILMTLVDAYERQEWPDDDLDPVDAIVARMENSGRTRKELEGIIGTSGRTSEILNRRRHLTLPMIWRLVQAWHIPAETLIRPYDLTEPVDPGASGRSRKLDAA